MNVQFQLMRDRNYKCVIQCELRIYFCADIYVWRNISRLEYVAVGIYADGNIRQTEYSIGRLFNAERSRIVADHGHRSRQVPASYRAAYMYPP